MTIQEVRVALTGFQWGLLVWELWAAVEGHHPDLVAVLTVLALLLWVAVLVLPLLSQLRYRSHPR